MSTRTAEVLLASGDLFLRFLDAAAPPFFLLGLLAAVLSYWTEYIGGMASRGKTRPINVPSSCASSSSSCSPTTSAIKSFLYGDRWSVPKRLFAHYYVAGLISLAAIIYVWEARISQSPGEITTTHPMTLAAAAILALSIAQCLRRIYECYFVHIFATASRMHLLFYILANFYYISIPANLLDLPIEGMASERRILADSRRQHHLIPVVLGASMFGLWAQYQQYRHHLILAGLRRSLGLMGERCNEDSYKIPKGGWFDHVTCPHYTAEVLLYLSYGVLIWVDGRLPLQLPNSTDDIGVLCREYRYFITLGFVFANLLFAALGNHYWYLANFDEYKELNRKAMIPFIL